VTEKPRFYAWSHKVAHFLSQIENPADPMFTGSAGPLRRAIGETRTRGLHLGKVALYQLSYYRIGYVSGDQLSVYYTELSAERKN
jgi:hypothetical protein